MEWHQVQPASDVVSSDLLDGGVLFDLNTKQYYELNRSGLLAWQHLEGGADLSRLESRLSERLAGGGGEDPFGLRSFVAALAGFGLVEARAEAAPRATSSAPPHLEPAAWESPPKVEPHGNPLSEVILSPFDPTVPIPE
jgi:hypothetical protein